MFSKIFTPFSITIASSIIAGISISKIIKDSFLIGKKELKQDCNPQIKKYPFLQPRPDVKGYVYITNTSTTIEIYNFVKKFPELFFENIVSEEECTWNINRYYNDDIDFNDEVDNSDNSDSNSFSPEINTRKGFETGRVGIKFNEGIIYYTIQKSTKGYALRDEIKYDRFESISSNISVEHINDFIKFILNKNENNGEGTYRLYHYVDDGWSSNGDVSKRSLKNLYMDEKDKNEIVTDLSKFLSKDTVKLYKRLGQKHVRTYLLYGPPGTGKSSMISCLASKFNRSISTIVVGKNTTNQSLVDAFKWARGTTFIIIEDFDSIIHASGQRETNNSLNFSTIMNLLDGHLRKEGSIIFLTTNFPEKCKGVIDRPGRIDFRLKFKKMGEKQIKDMVSNFFRETNEEECSKISKLIFKQKPVPSAASMQKFLFNILKEKGENISINTIEDNINFLKEEISRETERENIDSGNSLVM